MNFCIADPILTDVFLIFLSSFLKPDNLLLLEEVPLCPSPHLCPWTPHLPLPLVAGWLGISSLLSALRTLVYVHASFATEPFPTTDQ